MRVRPDPYDVAGQIAVRAAASPSDVLCAAASCRAVSIPSELGASAFSSVPKRRIRSSPRMSPAIHSAVIARGANEMSA